MPFINFFSRQAKDNHFLQRSAQGSALIMCLVFLSALSTIALSGLEAAWSGQRMISAYVSHQQTFLRLERRLLLDEHMAWQRIKTSGLEQFLINSQEANSQQTGTVVKVYGQWIDSEFSQQRCGALFEVIVMPQYGVSSELQLTVRWEVCCQSNELCMQAHFTHRRRLWSRVTESSASKS